MSRTDNRRHRRVLALILAALFAGVGGAGLFASTLTVTTGGNSGSGTVPVAASCDAAITVSPGEASWNTELRAFAIDSITLSDMATACDGSLVTVNVLVGWSDPATGESGKDVILTLSETVAVDGAGSMDLPFTQECDNTGDGVIDPGCTEPFPITVADYQELAILIQDDPDTLDEELLPGDTTP